MMTSAKSQPLSLLAKQKKELRATIRARRRQLSSRQQQLAATHLIRVLNKSGLILKANYIALYLGNDGEIDPSYFLDELWSRKKKVYLPVIQSYTNHRIVFCEITPHTKLHRNRFGILEPNIKTSKRLAAKQLSLVLMPLVAFDALGNRIGMGGGYYDRAFAFKKNSKGKPALLGLAHDFQKIERLPTEAWDIPIDGVATDKKLYS